MLTPAAQRDREEIQIKRRNLGLTAIAFVVLVPLPLALMGQCTLAGVLCILVAVYASMHPEFGAQPKAAIEDLIRTAGSAPLPAAKNAEQARETASADNVMPAVNGNIGHVSQAQFKQEVRR